MIKYQRPSICLVKSRWIKLLRLKLKIWEWLGYYQRSDIDRKAFPGYFYGSDYHYEYFVYIGKGQ